MQIVLTFLGSLWSGRYFDSHGARNLVIVGTTLNIVSLVATACKSTGQLCCMDLRWHLLISIVCQKYYQFMLAHALYGISGSVLWTPSTAVIGQWFLRNRGTASGIAVCGSGLGGVIYPIMLNHLFSRIGAFELELSCKLICENSSERCSPSPA